MSRLIEQSMAHLLEAFSSPTPTPGGGSAAALAGALGTALLLMVASMPRTRRGTDEERTDLDAAAHRLSNTRDHLAALVDLDSRAYEAVVAAYRLPRTTDSERASRTAAIQAALHGAIEVPLDVMRACVAAAMDGVVVAVAGNRNAASDVGVGVELLAAALRGASANVGTNLRSLTEEGYAAGVRAEQQRLETTMATATADARAALEEGPAIMP